MKKLALQLRLCLLVCLTVSCSQHSLIAPSRVSTLSSTAATDCSSPPLTRDRLLDVLVDVLELPSQAELLRDYEVSIEPRGCDSAVLLSLRDPVAVEPLFFVIDRSGRVVNPPTCWWLGDLGNCRFDFQGEPLSLASLRPGCSIQKAWIGANHLPWGAWLTCDGRDPIPLVHPLNLLGRVTIETEADALALVRFFSSPSTYQLFPLDGVMDIALAQGPWKDKLVPLLRQRGVFHEPQVESRSEQSFCFNESGERHTCTRTIFTVRRLIALYDGNIYDTTEKVTEDGTYSVLSRDLVLSDFPLLGLRHEPASLPSPFGPGPHE